MLIWAIANQKGGVGKTTTSLCLARNLAESGARVLLVDLDPHSSLTRAFGVPSHPPPAGTHDIFNGPDAPLGSLARSTAIDGLREGYDYALLDCPPTLGLLMVNALAAADRLVIPTQTDPLAMHGLNDMVRTADMVERSRRRPLARHIIPTLYDRRTRSGVKSLELLQDCHPSHCWHKAVPMDTRLRDPSVLTAEEPPTGRGADAYRSALAWLLDKADVRKEAA